MSAETYADQLLAAPLIESTGETMSAEGCRPYLDTDRPTEDEAAALVAQMMGAGTVARLDLLLDALRAAYRRGQAAERQESDRLAGQAAARFAEAAQALALEHAASFSAAHLERERVQVEHDARPWFLQ